jgi:hypothetical protein
MEAQMSEAIFVGANTWLGWREYARRVDYVPDPMTLRTAELFFNGWTGCRPLKQPQKQIWAAIESNLHGLLTFVDMLLTRDCVPLIEYNATYRPGAVKAINQLVGKLATPVLIDGAVYGEVRKAAVDKLKALDLQALPEPDVMNVVGEMTAYVYDWEPDLLDLDLKDRPTRRVAQFLLGGLIFGWYAEASETDHLIQQKRSRLFAALTKPGDGKKYLVFDQEAALFEELRRACVGADSVWVNEIPANPTVLPYILLGSGQPPGNTLEVLDRILKLRNSGLGRSYRAWFGDIRECLSRGMYASDAKRDIDQVRAELDQRLRGEFPKWSREVDLAAKLGPTLSISVEAPTGPKFEFETGLAAIEAKTKLRLGVPDWIRNWLLDLNPFGRHRKLLLRAALAQSEYRDVVKDLRRLWKKS